MIRRQGEIDQEDVGEDGMSSYEREYAEHFKAHRAEVEAAEAEMHAATRKAIELSEKYMIPIHGLGAEDYIPHSLMVSEQFKKLSFEELEAITENSFLTPFYMDMSGWISSSMTC